MKNIRYSRVQSLVLLVGVGVVLLAASPASTQGFVHGPVVTLDGVEYYLAGVPDGPGGATDVPGHYWVQAGPRKLVGKHYNTGPFEMPSWWSSDAPDGALLYVVKGLIDTWSPEKAAMYFADGFTHYHEFVSVADGSNHLTKVLWLKHIARTSFTFDRGPMPGMFDHYVTPGVDFEFMPNWDTPYVPE